MSGRTAQLVADGFTFLEGPRWRDDRLIVSDFHSGRVLAFEADGAVETVCTIDGRPSGLGWLPDGSLLIVSMLERVIMRWVDGSLDVYADLSGLVSHALNDMAVDAEGRAYVGNLGFDAHIGAPIRATSIHRVDLDGSIQAVADNVVFPNGMAFSADGSRLLVAETYAARITEFSVSPDGSLHDRQTWASFAETLPLTIAEAVERELILPDGIALDAEGALWIGDANGQASLRVRRGGEILDSVSTAAQAPFAPALGGPNGTTLYLCAADPLRLRTPHTRNGASLLACEVEVPRGISINATHNKVREKTDERNI